MSANIATQKIAGQKLVVEGPVQAIGNRQTFLQNRNFFKWANSGLFFVYFRSFSNKQYNFYNKHM